MDNWVSVAAVIVAGLGVLVSAAYAVLRWMEFLSRDPEWDLAINFMKDWSNNFTDIEEFAKVYVSLKNLKKSRKLRHYVRVLDKALEEDKAQHRPESQQ